MSQKKPELKRKVGRPRLHAETKLVQFRVPVEVANTIEGVVATLKLVNQDVHTPSPVLLMEALRMRLNQLQNRNPKLVEKAVRSIDRALDAHYSHVKR